MVLRQNDEVAGGDLRAGFHPRLDIGVSDAHDRAGGNGVLQRRQREGDGGILGFHPALRGKRQRAGGANVGAILKRHFRCRFGFDVAAIDAGECAEQEAGAELGHAERGVHEIGAGVSLRGRGDVAPGQRAGDGNLGIRVRG